MPWVNSFKYKRYLRRENETMFDYGKSDYKQTLNDTGFLLWRLSPNKHLPGPGDLWNNPFEYITVYKCGHKVFVFVVHNEQALTFEDPLSVYPSDELVAKLSMLLT